MPKPITKILPTPTYNAGGGKVITRYDEKPLKAQPFYYCNYASIPKYGLFGQFAMQPKVNSAVKRTYPRLA